MKRSEKILLGVFAALFLLIVGGGAMATAIRHYLDLLEENEGLRTRILDMHDAIAQGSEWQRRHAWLEEHVPSFTSRQEAANRLLETVQKEADRLSISFTDRQFLEATRPVGPDGLPMEETGGYFDQATVRVVLAKVREKEVFAWMHALQSPGGFLGITRLQITPAGEGKTVNIEAEITQFYREKSPTKLSRVSPP
ncbi:MAG: hypothetical protein LDL31_05050 [Prosthecobacter sp.]|jgi:hypothetical protein|nr:hypothetical protein [Prosthecobacter sp.]